MMDPRHKLAVGPVKEYLLGKLDDRSAGMLEQQYFADQSVLLQMQAIEVALIEEYLDGRLKGPDRTRFEQRYLRVPELVRRLDQVRTARREHTTALPTRSPWLRPILAAACLAIVTVVVWQFWKTPTPPPVQIVDAPKKTSPITLVLSPGVVMGPGGRTVNLNLPAGEKSVRLIMELPGLVEPADFSVQVSTVGPPATDVWSSPSVLRSTPSAGGQTVTAELSSSRLGPGDYLVTVKDSAGAVRERYLFRAVTGNPQ